MAAEITDPFQVSIDALSVQKTQKVWSLIATVFGDLAERRDDTISSQALQCILRPLGVRPAALRVALHRLRKDGWIAGQKTGRNSRYHLTEFGYAQSELARPKIYGTEPEQPPGWHLVMLDPEEITRRSGLIDQLDNNGYVRLSKSIYLRSGRAVIKLDRCFSLIGTDLQIPDWMMGTVFLPELAKDHAALRRDLQLIAAELADLTGLAATETATLRTLVVHRWRLMVLKYPDLPLRIFPADWKCAETRSQVHRLLDKFPRPDLERVEALSSAV